MLEVEAVGLVKQTPKLRKHSACPTLCASVSRRETLRRCRTMFAAPPITEHQPQSWTYEHRHRLTERVARLDAGSLRRVLVLVFGDANGFRPRDEFTIDFEGLDRGVCATLDAFLDDVSSDAAKARRAVGLPEAEPPAPELPRGRSASTPRPRPARRREGAAAGFRCGGRRYSDPPAPLPGQSHHDRRRRPSRRRRADGLYSREGGLSGMQRHPARPRPTTSAAAAAHHRRVSEDDNESMGRLGGAAPEASREASTKNIVFRAVPVPRGLRASF